MSWRYALWSTRLVRFQKPLDAKRSRVIKGKEETNAAQRACAIETYRRRRPEPAHDEMPVEKMSMSASMSLPKLTPPKQVRPQTMQAQRSPKTSFGTPSELGSPSSEYAVPIWNRKSRPPAELADVMELEYAARRHLIASTRALLRTATQSSMTRLHAQRRASAARIRADQEEYTGKDLKVKLRQVPVATEQEVTAISCQLNAGVAHLWPEGRGQSTFFKLFRYMDSDGSGLISYHELLRMIRDNLRIGPFELSDREVQGLWRALDNDESGTINAGEFIKMMRKGYRAQQQSGAETARPLWSPVTKVQHQDRGTPEFERAKALEELRKSMKDKVPTPDRTALTFTA